MGSGAVDSTQWLSVKEETIFLHDGLIRVTDLAELPSEVGASEQGDAEQEVGEAAPGTQSAGVRWFGVRVRGPGLPPGPSQQPRGGCGAGHRLHGPLAARCRAPFLRPSCSSCVLLLSLLSPPPPLTSSPAPPIARHTATVHPPGVTCTPPGMEARLHFRWSRFLSRCRSPGAGRRSGGAAGV